MAHAGEFVRKIIYILSTLPLFPPSDAPGDKVMEAARLCLDYCNDPEGAISILSAAQRWLPALQLALRYSRKDLFEEVSIVRFFCDAANFSALLFVLHCALLPFVVQFSSMDFVGWI